MKGSEMETMTHDQIRAEFGVEDISPELVAEYRVCRGPQRQGDVTVWPCDDPLSWDAVSVPAEGVPVVRGDVRGHTHTLRGGGMWAPNPNPTTATDLRLGVVTVPEGEVAFLGHEEHRMKVIGSGCYTIERQRERQRIVHD